MRTAAQKAQVAADRSKESTDWPEAQGEKQ
jgi:hypothetical protein